MIKQEYFLASFRIVPLNEHLIQFSLYYHNSMFRNPSQIAIKSITQKENKFSQENPPSSLEPRRNNITNPKKSFSGVPSVVSAKTLDVAASIKN